MPFRNPHSAFRNLLVGALAACVSPQSARDEVLVTIPRGSTFDAAVDSLTARLFAVARSGAVLNHNDVLIVVSLDDQTSPFSEIVHGVSDDIDARPIVPPGALSRNRLPPSL